MRILVLTNETPAYPGGGGVSRQHCLLEPLAERHRVRVVSTGGAPRFGSAPAGIELELVDPGEAVELTGPWLEKNATHYLSGRPWLHTLAEHHRRALAARLPCELDTFRPDAIVVQHGELGALLDAVPVHVARVLELHDMLLPVQLRKLGKGTPRDLVKAALEVALVARWEGHDLRAATVSITSTATDARLARRLARAARVEVVPDCVDASYFANPGDRPAADRIIFTASFHDPPNQEAARDLLVNVLPAVRRRRPAAELLLAGQGMPDWLVELVAASPGAATAADVADVRPLLWSASVALAPTRAGSGSPLKVLEALAAEVPVVASRRAARSLGIDAAGGVFGADSPEQVASAVVRLLDDAVAARRAARAGRERVVREFERRVVAPLFEEQVIRAVATARRERGALRLPRAAAPGGAPDVSVVVPTWHRPEALATAVRSVLSQESGHLGVEVVVSVSDPTSETDRAAAAALAAEDPRVRVAVAPGRGAAATRNTGLRASSGSRIALIDDDCVAAPGWLVAGMAALEDADLVQGRTSPAVPTVGWQRTIRVTEPSWLWECCNLFVRRAALERGGLFDEDWQHVVGTGHPWGEDAEWGWRLVRAGARHGFAQDALVHHAIEPWSYWKWLRERTDIRWLPMIVRSTPELRRRFHLGYFFDRRHLVLTVAAASLAAGGAARALGRRRAAGPLVLAGAAAYLSPGRRLRSPGDVPVWLRDRLSEAVEFGCLAWGTARYRRVVL